MFLFYWVWVGGKGIYPSRLMRVMSEKGGMWWRIGGVATGIKTDIFESMVSKRRSTVRSRFLQLGDGGDSQRFVRDVSYTSRDSRSLGAV